MTVTVLMQAPVGLSGSISGTPSGTIYSIPADGLVSVAQADVRSMLNCGFIPYSSQSAGVSGIAPLPVALLTGKNVAGTTLAASASAGNFGITSSNGVQIVLTGEAATGATKTDAVMFEPIVPANFIAGQALTVTVSAYYTGSGTAGTKTVGLTAYSLGNTGQMTALTVSPATGTLTGTAADTAFSITGATPGMPIALYVQTILQETGGSTSLTAQVNSVRLS